MTLHFNKAGPMNALVLGVADSGEPDGFVIVTSWQAVSYADGLLRVGHDHSHPMQPGSWSWGWEQ